MNFKYIITILTLISFFVFIKGCSYKEGLIPKQDKKGKFEIGIPDFLSSTKRLSEVSDFQFQNRFRTFYLVIIQSPISQIDKSFEDFTQAEITLLKNSVDSIYTDTFYLSKMNNMLLKNYKADLYLGDELFYYRLAFIEGIQSYYTIVIWTLERRKEEYGEMIEKMVNSFKLL